MVTSCLLSILKGGGGGEREAERDGGRSTSNQVTILGESEISNSYNILSRVLHVLMCVRGRCNNSRGDVMHKLKVSALHHRDRYCIVRVRSLQHISPANCLITVLLLI